MEVPQNFGLIDYICMVGHGSIGKGTLPLIKRHFTFKKITIIDPHPVEFPETGPNVEFKKVGLTPENFRSILDSALPNGAGVRFCVNLSVGTSSSEIIQYCQEKEIFYIDTVKEEWEGYYANESIDISKKSNYGLRESLLKNVRDKHLTTTAISCCGANPGMVSWLVKQALINLSGDLGEPLIETPKNS